MYFTSITRILLCNNDKPTFHVYSLGPQPCSNYSIDVQYIDTIFRDIQYTQIIQASICLGNTYGDLCYSPYFTDEVAIDICRNNVYSGVTGKCYSKYIRMHVQ